MCVCVYLTRSCLSRSVAFSLYFVAISFPPLLSSLCASLSVLLSLLPPSPPPRRNSVKIIFGDPLIVLLIFGGMVRFMAGYAIGSYLPTFYSQIYPDFNTTCELKRGKNKQKKTRRCVRFHFLDKSVSCTPSCISSFHVTVYITGVCLSPVEEGGERCVVRYISFSTTVHTVVVFRSARYHNLP